MNPKKTRKLDPSAARRYFGKAGQFAESMRTGLERRQWDAAGLGAVHAVISAADALLAAYGGIRSAEPDHRLAARLLEETLGRAAAPALRHISFVIAKKNVVEYEQRRLTENEARSIVEHAERFLSFADRMLGQAK